MRVAAAALVLLWLPGNAFGAGRPSEDEVKAAYLYNFTYFVTWPATAFPSPKAPLVIGVLGRDPIGNHLKRTIAGEQIKGRSLLLRQSNRIADLKSCQILFISASERARLPQVLAELRGLPVLTVGETRLFCQTGGMINFVMSDGKVVFEINRGAVSKAGLKPSARLFKVAKRVHR